MGYFNETNTTTSLGNTGLQQYPGTVGKWKYLVLVPKNTVIAATKVLALTKATWTDALNAAMASRWFVLPLIFNGEPTQDDPVREESDFGYVSFVRDGKLTYKITFEEISVYNKGQLNKLNNGDFEFVIITDKDKILGYTDDGAQFLPYQVDYFKVLPETQNTGSVNAHVMAELRCTDIRQMNELQVALDPVNDPDTPVAWYPFIELPAAAIKDLIITPSSMVAAGCTITLKGYDNVPYSGLVKEDLYMRKSTIDAVGIAITSDY